MLQSKLSNANQSDSDRNKSSVKTEGKELQDAPFPFLIYKPGKLYYACFEQKGNYEWQKERKQFTSVRIVGMRKRSGLVKVTGGVGLVGSPLLCHGSSQSGE